MNNKNGSRWTVLFLRIVIGIGFMALGRAKLSHGPGYEINLLYTAGLIVLMAAGGGEFALDKLIFCKQAIA